MPGFRELATFSKWTEAERDRFTVSVIRGLVMDTVRKAASGHTGGALSSADFATILFKDFLRFDPDNSGWLNRDRFVLSAGHESALLYSLLHLLGWLSLEDLHNFRQLDSRTPGHPEVGTPGVEATTGPLGQGVGMGTGMALAEAILHSMFAGPDPQERAVLDHRTYILAGDGDLQEPVALGVAALAGHWGLSRLIMFYDANAVQISGSVSRSDSTSVGAVFEALQWHVQQIDGHDHHALRTALRIAHKQNRPALIIGRTVMACGTATMQGQAATHGAPLPPEEIAATKAGLGLPPEDFWVPEEVVTHFRSRLATLRRSVRKWNTMLAERCRDTEFKARWNQVFTSGLPALTAPVFAEQTTLSTRKAFGLTLEKFAAQLPNLVGGSADLEPSNCTGGFAARWGDFQKQNRQGRNLAFGVREFPMAAILNGLALHGGIIPFGGTFLVFSDYERPALRLAAMQKLRVIHEFTHDSFYVGEDGPTHQAVEQTMSLRAIPGWFVFRPADACETAACFQLALERHNGPSALLLSRQNLPHLPLDSATIAAGVRRGGYRVFESSPQVEIVLIATGSEVALALEVARHMTDKSIRVVSLPCWELFELQPPEYRAGLIPARGCLKVSLEAGITLGWERFVGPTGITIGLNRFGVSAPAGSLAREFGFTAETVEQKIRKHIANLL